MHNTNSPLSKETSFQDLDISPIEDKQIACLNYLLSWTAGENGVHVKLVQTIFETEFCLMHFSKLAKMDFYRGVRFLVNLRIR